MLDLNAADPQLRHIDRPWASTVHAFQGRTVDTVIAAMEVRHPYLTAQKSFCVENSRARDRALRSVLGPVAMARRSLGRSPGVCNGTPPASHAGRHRT